MAIEAIGEGMESVAWVGVVTLWITHTREKGRENYFASAGDIHGRVAKPAVVVGGWHGVSPAWCLTGVASKPAAREGRELPFSTAVDINGAVVS
jgi:hypothetical protein